jgi:signal transduction histidine kinase
MDFVIMASLLLFHYRSVPMPKRLCIRNKMLIALLALIVIDMGVLFLLERRAEHVIHQNQKRFSEIMDPDSLLAILMTGNLRSDFMLIGNGPRFQEDSMTNVSLGIMRTFRNQLYLVFGVSLALGIGLTFYFSRILSRPIAQLAEGWEELGLGARKSRFLPDCVKLQALSHAMEKMKCNILEKEREKSRQKSVELTKNLAAGIAHEIKNPINTVGLTIDYLQSNLSPEDPEKRYEFFKLSDNLKHELGRINRVVDSFMRLTKPNVFSFNQEDINAIVRDAVMLFENEIAKDGVQLHAELDPEIPPLKIDRDKMNQVFYNLIINAIEAMPRGGEISLKSRQADRNTVEVGVFDNGIGIPDEDIEGIFSPYFTTKKQGFGLGLSMIQNIIHRHHGRITVTSQKGVGTQFIIQLPVDFNDK